jgi:beta-galactosidase
MRSFEKPTGRWALLSAALFFAFAAAGGGTAPSRQAQGPQDRAGASPGMVLSFDPAPRRDLLLDPGWKFHLGDAASVEGDFDYGKVLLYAKAGEAGGAVDQGFDDSAWRTVDLPHDWAVEQDFVKVDDENVAAHGYKPIGRQFPKTTIGWYRKAFDIPAADEGKRLAVKFDGVFRDAQVWLNNHYLGRNFSGYSEFLFDITDVANIGGRNVLVVRVDAGLYEGWFYEGAGIYRHVWLQEYDPLHIPQYGLFVWTEVLPGAARVHAETQVFNQSLKPVKGELRTCVLDDKGRTVAQADPAAFGLGPDLVAEVKQEIDLDRPSLWSLESPTLYRLVSEVRSEGRVVDRRETAFGVRTVLFDKDRGFFLNGKPVKIQGVCCHQDHAGVGSALPDRLQDYRIERLKEMGVNAYRTSHNPPTPELLEACDRLGMLVMDENRLMGSVPELMGQFEHLILRDRNHPSVIIWSVGNEEFAIQDTPVGRRIAQSLVQRQKELDPTRLCTYAGNNGRNFEGVNEVVDVRGFNYHLDEIDAYRKAHPDQVLWGTETASTVCTRGVYANDPDRGYVADYDQNFPPWASTAEKWWSLYGTRPWLMGGFAWTGFDYRGEPTPYAWPCINSHFGIMDMCGFPKNNYYYYQAWWTDKDVLHIAPHWNWPGREGKTIDVWCESNCDSVELFLNGRSLGRKVMPRLSHLEWKVPYQPGILSAKGWKKGRVVTARVETTGAPVSILLAPDRTRIKADAEDVAVFTVTSLDAQGREVPVADNLVRFELKGPGRIIGVGNGDPSSHEPDKCPAGGWQRRLFSGKCQVIVQATKAPGPLTLTATADGLKPAASEVTAEPGPLRPRVD